MGFGYKEFELTIKNKIMILTKTNLQEWKKELLSHFKTEYGVTISFDEDLTDDELLRVFEGETVEDAAIAHLESIE